MRRQKNNPAGLKFFGFNKLLPYLKNHRKPILGLILGCLFGSIVDMACRCSSAMR